MKDKLKAALPESAVRAVRTLLNAHRRRRRPRATQYAGSEESVLQCVIAYNAFGGYCLPQSSIHRPAAQAILAGKVWEPRTIDYVMDRCGSGDIIHAGTYFGDFLPAFSRACSPGAGVWAFEPNPENFRCASITVSINGLSNVHLVNAGLGSEAGVLPFEVADEADVALGGRSRFAGSNSNGRGTTVDVETTRIDDAVPEDRFVSILQLDVEGFEQEALLGGIETIRRSKPLIILENVPPQAWMSDHILSMGYRRAGQVHSNAIFAADRARTQGVHGS